ncbi:MAG: HXXEE domain-containing protein, partial [Chthoniobacterales bacterium]
GGVEVLSRPATFVINSLGVWVVDLVAIYLAVFVAPGWGLMAFYLPLINTVGHVGQAVALHRSNPGLWTALGLFLPLAGAGLWIVSQAGGVTFLMQVVGFAVALVIHAAIIIHVKRTLARGTADEKSGET